MSDYCGCEVVHGSMKSIEGKLCDGIVMRILTCHMGCANNFDVTQGESRVTLDCGLNSHRCYPVNQNSRFQ